jgi:hypothetical protein
MREVRQKLTEVLDEYFEGLEKDLKQKLRGLESQREEFLKAEERLAQEAQALANLNNELQGSNYVRLVI